MFRLECTLWCCRSFGSNPPASLLMEAEGSTMGRRSGGGVSTSSLSACKSRYRWLTTCRPQLLNVLAFSQQWWTARTFQQAPGSRARSPRRGRAATAGQEAVSAAVLQAPGASALLLAPPPPAAPARRLLRVERSGARPLGSTPVPPALPIAMQPVHHDRVPAAHPR